MNPSRLPAGRAEPQTEALRRQALLLELTPVLMRDPEDKIIYWNRSAEVMYGFTRVQALGRLAHELLRTEFPEPLENIVALLHTGRQWRGELTHRKRRRYNWRLMPATWKRKSPGVPRNCGRPSPSWRRSLTAFPMTCALL
jgi:PAS domain S-box-containing protein